MFGLHGHTTGKVKGHNYVIKADLSGGMYAALNADNVSIFVVLNKINN